MSLRPLRVSLLWLIAIGSGLASGSVRADGCLPGMVAIEDFCIDRYEAAIDGQSPYLEPNPPGPAVTGPNIVPQGYISGQLASQACQQAGKRLCTDAEWLRACRGPAGHTYPYGDVYDPAACNDSRPEHPVITLFGPGATWSTEELTDPRLNQLPDSLDPTGSNPACVTAEGVYDMHGNLHEWTADPNGTFRGGSYVEGYINGEGCLYQTTAHDSAYLDFSTGFRCCADAGAAVPQAVPGVSPAWGLGLAAALAGAAGGWAGRRRKRAARVARGQAPHTAEG